MQAACAACAPPAARSRRSTWSIAPACGPAPVGRMAGVNVPLQAAEHYYLISEPVPGVHPMLPILRDPGNSAYIREEAGKIMVGLFEAEGAALGHWTGIPDDFRFGEIPPDWDRMYPYIEKAMRRVPCLLETGIKLLFCGPESFTADHNYLMGEAPNLQEFLRRGGLQFARHPLGRRRRIRDGALDRGGPRAHGCVVGESAPHARLAEQRSLSAGSDRRDARHRLSGPLAVPAGRDRAGREEERAARSARGGGSLLRRVGRMGAAELVCAAAAKRAAYEYGWGRQNWFANNAEEHRSRARAGRACSSNPRSPSS